MENSLKLDIVRKNKTPATAHPLEVGCPRTGDIPLESDFGVHRPWRRMREGQSSRVSHAKGRGKRGPIHKHLGTPLAMYTFGS